MSELSISNVVNISVAQAGSGLGRYNPSNLALFSTDPVDSSFGSDGFKIFVAPGSVADFFGTQSKTNRMANAIFSQAPNILAAGAYLTIIPMIQAIQNLAFSGVAASGNFILEFGGDNTVPINWNDSLAQIQAKVRVLPGLEQAIVTGSIATSLNIRMEGFYGPAALVVVGANSLETSVPAAIVITPTTTQEGETLEEAIERGSQLVQFAGIMCTSILPDADVEDAAVLVQTMNKILGFVSDQESSLEAGGIIDDIRLANLNKTRGLYRGQGDELECLRFLAAYFGRAFSTNFEGNNTTQNMHLKDLAGITPDLSIDQTILEKAQNAGADVYVSLEGVAKVFSSGANKFFDQVYNLSWFVGALQVAGFNYLARVSTKIPQTEPGMDGLKAAYRRVCNQGVVNAYLAPGQWNDPTTFGNQENFFQNISEVGYYIYSSPIAMQSQETREEREAPLVQIAAKEAGAINRSNVLVSINA